MIALNTPVNVRQLHRESPRAVRPVRHDGAYLAQRLSAIAADTSATSEMQLATMWRDLARGGSRIVDGFFTDERCYLVLASNPGTATPIDGRRLEILAAVLKGFRQKNIAMDLSLAPSTVALNSRLALESLGVDAKPSRAHPLLMLAARAITEPTPAPAKSCVIITDDNRELRVVSMARPDTTLSKLLPGAEMAVIRSLVEGLSYQEIARQRGTSTRTIANQISAVFRRLRVSGRNELVQRLFFEDLGRTRKVSAEALGVPASRKAPGATNARRSA